jgi:plasmid maintenance system antidote protein VapI
MYKNLKAELVRNDITNIEVAKRLSIKPGTASLKINGKAKLSLNEAFSLQNLIYEKSGITIPIEELFKV